MVLAVGVSSGGNVMCEPEESSKIILDKRIAHMHGVAEYMYANAEKYNLNKEEMFIVGLLHDIGYLYGKPGHAKNGAKLLESMGFKYAEEIGLHGTIPQEGISDVLRLLLEADLSIGTDGSLVGYDERLKNIGERLGKESKEYKIAENTVEFLRKEN